MQKQYAYFSAAIREGAKLRPQSFGSLYQDGSSCALGAGYEAAAAHLQPKEAYAYILATFSYLKTRAPNCPLNTCNETIDTDGVESQLVDLVVHLNDFHKWTREAIADWLYAEEEKLGFVTVIDTEALKPEMISEFSTSKATV